MGFLPEACPGTIVLKKRSAYKGGTAMPVAVKIKDGEYGKAIGMLLMRGGSFQTRHERILIVTSDQRKVLEEADLIEINGLKDGIWPIKGRRPRGSAKGSTN